MKKREKIKNLNNDVYDRKEGEVKFDVNCFFINFKKYNIRLIFLCDN